MVSLLVVMISDVREHIMLNILDHAWDTRQARTPLLISIRLLSKIRASMTRYMARKFWSAEIFGPGPFEKVVRV